MLAAYSHICYSFLPLFLSHVWRQWSGEQEYCCIFGNMLPSSSSLPRGSSQHQRQRAAAAQPSHWLSKCLQLFIQYLTLNKSRIPFWISQHTKLYQLYSFVNTVPPTSLGPTGRQRLIQSLNQQLAQCRKQTQFPLLLLEQAMKLSSCFITKKSFQRRSGQFIPFENLQIVRSIWWSFPKDQHLVAYLFKV